MLFPHRCPVEQPVNTTFNKFLDMSGLSTSEFSGGYKPEVVLWIRDAPEINGQTSKDEKIHRIGDAVPKVEGPGGLVFLSSGIESAAGVHDRIPVLEVRAQPGSFDQGKGAKADEKGKIEALQPFSEIDLLSELMD